MGENPGGRFGGAWQRGSVDYFRDEWIKQQPQTSFIFPRAEPRGQWDAFEHLKAEAFLERVRAAVPEGGRVLEYGCGAAGILIFLSNQGYRGTGLDATAQALRIARRNDAIEGDAGRPGPSGFVQANALAMPFADGAFDCVVSNGLLEHFAPEVVPPLLGEIIRVLRPGGLFLADIAHRRASTRQAAKPLNFAVSYAAQVARRQGIAAAPLWRAVSAPMYENAFDRHDWAGALTAAGLEGVDVHGFRLPPPLSLPATLDRAYGRMMLRARPLRWAAALHRYHVPLTWLYVAAGRKPGVAA